MPQDYLVDIAPAAIDWSKLNADFSEKPNGR